MRTKLVFITDDAYFTKFICYRFGKHFNMHVSKTLIYPKGKQNLFYVLYGGLAQTTNWVKLKFAAINMKKLITL